MKFDNPNDTSVIMEKPFRVVIREYERGWGSKIESIRAFTTLKEAEEFIEGFNGVNTMKKTPDWYMQAEPLYRL